MFDIDIGSAVELTVAADPTLFRRIIGLGNGFVFAAEDEGNSSAGVIVRSIPLLIVVLPVSENTLGATNGARRGNSGNVVSD